MAVSYPKLYESIIKFAPDVTECYIEKQNCRTNIYTYDYPMKYMKEVPDLQRPVEWHYVVSLVSEVYYDSDNDGYVDSSRNNAYLVAPIDEYNERFGELTN